MLIPPPAMAILLVGGSLDRSGFAPGVWARRILLPYGLLRPGGSSS